MTVFIIGVVTIVALLWLLAASLANESDAEKRQVRQFYFVGEEGPQQVSYTETKRAA
ncbi:MAG: hypothetical protein LZF60_50221 [Nitrospira sp.]|nr:hypothetical protein [Nitrospira sp.]ULA58487.1 MAG: hypothetical protein LZF60_50221 [Nitrospira sp.]